MWIPFIWRKSILIINVSLLKCIDIWDYWYNIIMVIYVFTVFIVFWCLQFVLFMLYIRYVADKCFAAQVINISGGNRIQ
jgi:hypothetical protein